MTVILVTPSTEANIGAKPVLRKVSYWALDDFRGWAQHAINVVRKLKVKLPPQSDLFWREEAQLRLHESELTQTTIRNRLKVAAEAMKFNE